jgi:hypothetical protein
MLKHTINIHWTKQIPRQPGYWRGKVVIKKDFDKLPKRLIAAFKGKEK